MDKSILKKVAKRWAMGILLSTEMDIELDEYLSIEEQDYLQKEVHRIGRSLCKEEYEASVITIIKDYYDYE